MRKPSLLAVVLLALGTVLWSRTAIVSVIYLAGHESGFFLILTLLCALIWIAVFIVNLKRYLAHKDD